MGIEASHFKELYIYTSNDAEFTETGGRRGGERLLGTWIEFVFLVSVVVGFFFSC